MGGQFGRRGRGEETGKENMVEGKGKGRGRPVGKGRECIKDYDIGLLLRVRCFIIIILMTCEISEIENCYPDILGA